MRGAMMAVAAMVAWCAVADVPTQAEFTAAGNVIADLMEPQMAAVKSIRKTATEGCHPNDAKTVCGSNIYGMKPFVGAIADFSVYNRVLSPEEIMRLYKN